MPKILLETDIVCSFYFNILRLLIRHQQGGMALPPHD
jgi:hypothetical protein